MYNTDLPSRAELPSAGKLMRSTVVAALIAMALLVTTVLPAEYGIDPTGIGRVLGLTQMGKIKVFMSTVAEPERDASTPQEQQVSGQQHAMTVLLKPGKAAEIKLTMRKGAAVQYEWTAQGGVVDYDGHGDPIDMPKGFYHGYGKGRGAASDTGTLQAAFDGTHGWFWRNRTQSEVIVTLKTNGDYKKIKRVL
jgi:hypothetical protein